MARWVGEYTVDSTRTFQRVSLRVFAVDLTIGSRTFLGGESRETDQSFDLLYLPTIFSQNVKLGGVCCQLPVSNLRHFRAFFAENSYLFIPNPFPGDSTDFVQMYQELTQNPQIRYWIHRGETIQNTYLKTMVNP